VCRYVLETFNQPALVEVYLPGREFTVGILGTGRAAKVLGVMEVILVGDPKSNPYGYENKTDFDGKLEYQLALGDLGKECAEVALKAWRSLNCRDGGRIDVKLDENGRAYFLEVNPLAGLTENYSDLSNIATLVGLPYAEIIGGIARSALHRAGLARPSDTPIFRMPTGPVITRQVKADEVIHTNSKAKAA
jgi:D-alanine-D-alanine ligase